MAAGVRGRVSDLLGSVIVAVALAGAWAAAQTPVEKGPTALAVTRKYLEGRWALMSFRIFPGGKPVPLEAAGVLTFDAFSNLNMEIRVNEETARVLERDGIPTVKGIISTAGRVVADPATRTLTYILPGQPLMAPAGGPLSLRRPRHWEVNGNVLILTTRGDDGTTVSEGRWQKTP
jgi:hypothetical protein